jgi:hypothetical protein
VHLRPHRLHWRQVYARSICGKDVRHDELLNTGPSRPGQQRSKTNPGSNGHGLLANGSITRCVYSHLLRCAVQSVESRTSASPSSLRFGVQRSCGPHLRFVFLGGAATDEGDSGVVCGVVWGERGRSRRPAAQFPRGQTCDAAGPAHPCWEHLSCGSTWMERGGLLCIQTDCGRDRSSRTMLFCLDSLPFTAGLKAVVCHSRQTHRLQLGIVRFDRRSSLGTRCQWGRLRGIWLTLLVCGTTGSCSSDGMRAAGC